MTGSDVVALVVAACLLGGAPWWMTGALAVGLWAPAAGLAAALAGAALARRQRPSDPDEAVVLSALASELRRGASLRTAIEPAASRSPRVDLDAAVRLAEAGAPVERVAEAFGAAFPTVGRLAGPALEAASTSGGAAAAVFARLAHRAGLIDALAVERRSSTAQARLSAVVVGGIPCAVLGGMVVTGRFSDLLAGGALGVWLVAVGTVLMLAGVSVVVAVTRRGLL